MSDQTSYQNLPVAYFFKLIIGNSPDLDTSFMEVSGIGQSMQTESYRELGENRYEYKLPTFISNSGNLVVKRAVAHKISPLVQWCKKVLEEYAIPIKTKSIQVQLMGPDVKAMYPRKDEDVKMAQFKVLRSWTFLDAYPVKWTVGSFNSKSNEVAIETIEFAYTYCKRGD